MNQRKVQELAFLIPDQETTAIFPVIPEKKKTHKINIPGIVDRIHELNPTPLSTKPIELVTYERDRYADTTKPNLLDYKEDFIRHTFNDDYYQIVAIYMHQENYGTERIDPIFTPIQRWQNSSEDDPVYLNQSHYFWKHADNAFRIVGSQRYNALYLKALYGYRMITEVPAVFETQLKFTKPLNTLRFVRGRPVNYRMPAATGGTAPYTYTMTGLPASLAFDPNTLHVTGTAAGARGITYIVTDDDGEILSESFDILLYGGVSWGFNISRGALPYSTTLPAASGGVPPYSYSISSVFVDYDTAEEDWPGYSYSFNPISRQLTVTLDGEWYYTADVTGAVGTVRDAVGQTYTHTDF